MFGIEEKLENMADDKNKQDGRDRSQVSANENYEVEYLAKTLGASPEEVREAINAVGNNREALEEYLRK